MNTVCTCFIHRFTAGDITGDILICEYSERDIGDNQTVEHVLTVSDFDAARELGVRFSGPGGEGAVSTHVLGEYAALAAEGRFSIPVAGAFPLEDWRTAAELSLSGRARGKVVLEIG